MSQSARIVNSEFYENVLSVDVMKLSEQQKRWIRYVVGTLLIVAAILKAHELATLPMPEVDFWSSKATIHTLVIFELLLGISLISHINLAYTWTCVVFAFSVFLIVTFLKAIGGLESCGCFGRLKVDPWTTFVVDAAVLLMLVLARPSPLRYTVIAYRKLQWVVVATAVIALPLSVWIISYTPSTLEADGIIKGDDGFILLEPQKWIGSRFPLTSHIDNSDSLNDGEWIVVLYHYDCPKCQTVLPQYRRSAKNKFDVKTALIEMPPYGNINTSVDCLEVKLSDEFEWFVTAPVELRLNDGVVVGVSSETEALALHQANR